MSAAAKVGVVTEALSGVFATIDGLRSYAYFPDTFQPPGVVVGHPEIAFTGDHVTICSNDLTFPCHLVVARSSDRAVASTLFDFLDQMIAAVEGDSTLGGACELAQVLSASPETVAVNGTELPGYLVQIRTIA